MVTVGTGLVGVDWEPLLLALWAAAEVSIDLLGRVRAVEDLKKEFSNQDTARKIEEFFKASQFSSMGKIEGHDDIKCFLFWESER